MKINIRPAVIDDSNAINLLSHQLGYPLTQEETRHHLAEILEKKNEAVFVAVNNNAVIGWIGVFKTLHLVSGYLCEVAGLVIDLAYHRQGAGKLLVDQAAKWSRNQGCTDLRVRTNTKRKQAHQFYLGLGFAEIKEQKVYEIKMVSK